MSAWTVSKGHIDCLVQSLAVEGLVSFRDADEVGRELWAENYRSVNYRYDESEPTPEYSFEGVEAPLDVVVVLKQIACYEYQSCEHGDWLTSNAHRLTEQLGERLLAKLGFTTWKPFYESAAWRGGPWGIESILEALKQREVSVD